MYTEYVVTDPSSTSFKIALGCSSDWIESMVQWTSSKTSAKSHPHEEARPTGYTNL